MRPGHRAVAQTVEITWASGTVQTFQDVPADRILRVSERHADC